MRTITTAQQAVLDSGVQAEFVRLSVKDDGGTWRDVTTYPGFNALTSIGWKFAINDPHGTFDAAVKRELFQLSLAPFMEDSALNRGFDPTADYAPLITDNRLAKIEVAIVPLGSTPQSGDWMEVFLGRIDHVDSASGEDVAFGGRSLSGRLAQQYIKLERVYAFAAVSGATKSLRIWSPEMVVTAGEYVVPASRGDATSTAPADPGFNRFFVCATGGTAGLVEPTWSTGSGIVDGATVRWNYAGAPSTSGFAVEDVMQLILDDNKGIGDSTVTLNTPSSPLWDITEYLQGRGFTWDALSALAGQIGWDLRDLFDEGSSTWKLTFYEPDRAVVTADFSFSPSDHGKLEECSVDPADIRNSGRIIYKDVTDPYPDGTPARHVLDDSDPTSITEHGELWGEIQEDETSNINTDVEAQRLMDSFLSDCAEPDVVMRVPIERGFPWAELNDFYEFVANGLQYSSNKKLAVTEISQNFADGKLKTKFGVRGKPTIGTRRHLAKLFHPNKPQNQSVHRLEHFQGQKTPKLDISDVVAGGHMKVVVDTGPNALVAEYELHVYKTPGTPLDASTLAFVGSARDVEISNVIPGQDYQAVVVPRHWNAGQLVRGQPSAEHTFTAGRAGAGHLVQDVEWGRCPLNGGFETWNDVGTLPDHWLTNQTWGVNFTRQNGSGGVSGDSWLRFVLQAVGIATIFTEEFTIEKTVDYQCWWWVNIITAGSLGSVKLQVSWFDYAHNLVSTDDVDLVAHNQSDMTVGTWYRRGGVVSAPEDARFATVVLKQQTNGDMVLDVDSVRVERA